MKIRPQKSPRILLCAISAVTLAVALSACGKHEDKQVATQVAAKVGDDEISVHQINMVLNAANTSGASAQDVQRMSREVLEKLIDQQLAIAQANKKELNRSPEVLAQIEASKREILARAYVQQLVGGLPKPTADEVKKYYNDNPQLFSERRVFNVQELIIPAQDGLVELLTPMANAGKPMEDIVNVLKSKDIKFNGGSATRAAEQIPLEMLKRLQPLKDGQSLVAQTPQAVTFIRIASSRTMPLDEATASPRIEQFLGNQRANEAIASNMKGLRQASKIEYMGDFAKPLETAAAPAAPAPTASKADDQANLEKGVAGLK